MKNIFIIPLVSFFFCITTIAGHAQIANVSDSLALVAFYDSAKGPTWAYKTGWLLGPVNTWEGITLDATGRVISIGLQNDDITGTLAPEIGNLTSLQSLNLSNNVLNGSIPAEIGNLVNLQALILTSTWLSGSIPAQIGRLRKLQELHLDYCKFSGAIPDSLGYDTSLVNLYLENNGLSGNLPSTLGNLLNLQNLYLSNNTLTGNIPTSFGNLLNLQILDLNNNQLSGEVPASIANITNLQALLLAQNQFTFDGLEFLAQKYPTAALSPQHSIPLHSIGNTYYVLAGGTISNNTYQWYKDGSLLVTVHGDSSFTIPELSGRYCVIVNNALVPTLTLHSDTVQFYVPTNLSDSLALVALYDSTNGPGWAVYNPPSGQRNWLSAPVPTWPGVAVTDSGRVTQLSLSSFNITGHLPTQLGNLPYLTSLDLSFNKITDSIPSSIGNLSNLRTLNLSYNLFTGNIPSSFGNLNKLTDLEFVYNQLSDSIPASFGNLSSLQFLKLSYNELTGNIPPELGDLTNLQDMQLDNNMLTGSIPAEIGNLASIRGLFLNSNALTGNIPASFANLNNLSSLELDRNNLTGGLPLSDSVIKQHTMYLEAQYNHFNFSGFESLARAGDRNFVYFIPQTVPMQYSNGKLSIVTGNVATNNLYYWHSTNPLSSSLDSIVSQGYGDSTFTVSYPGWFYVVVADAYGSLQLYGDTINITDAVLPITFINFTAQAAHGGNLLRWQTGAGVNSSYFDVQRSTDGVSFYSIGNVTSNANNSASPYEFTDPLSGINIINVSIYYRIKEVDKNSNVAFSKVAVINTIGNSTARLVLFPNPVHNSLSLQIKGLEGPYELRIIDETGKTSLAQQSTVTDGQIITIDVTQLAGGVYFARLYCNKQWVTQKFIKE